MVSFLKPSFMKLLRWSSFNWSSLKSSRLASWTLDRNGNRAAGERLLKDRKYEAASHYLELAVADADAKGRSAKRVQVRLKLAEAQHKQGKLDQAEQTLRQGIEIAARTGERVAYLLCLDALAGVFEARGDYLASEKLSQEGILIESAMPHPDPLRMARRVHRLGIARYRRGPSGDALTAIEKGLKLYQQVYGLEHEETAQVLSELGAIYRAHGRHAEAQEYLRRSLRVHQRALGVEDPQSIQDLHQLAGSLEESGEIERAAWEYERVIELRQRVAGHGLAELQFSLARLYIRWGNYRRALELLNESIGAFKRKAGPRLAVACETRAQVEEMSGRFQDAVRELDYAGRVWEACPGCSAELAANMEYRADLLEQLHRRREAAFLRERAAHVRGRAAGA
jgi:tetratricopeptide (TPR) repeat protein